MKRLSIPAKLLRDGDKLISSRRYRHRLHGIVKIGTAGNGMVFLDAPTLPDEDVAFRDGDTVEIMREVS